MSTKHTLTNEALSKRFDSPFALVNYSIRIARDLILKGEDFQSNPATDVLMRIADRRELYLDIVEDEEEEEEEVA